GGCQVREVAPGARRRARAPSAQRGGHPHAAGPAAGRHSPVLRAVRRRTGLRESDMVAEDTEPDPLTGRHGYQREGGIWAPRLRGRFRPGAGEIDLFAFVYEERSLRVPEVQTVLLWLDQAGTLAHEA